MTQTRFVNEEVSASLPALSYAVPAVSLSGCRAVDQGPGKVDTDAEVGDKAVTEVPRRSFSGVAASSFL